METETLMAMLCGALLTGALLFTWDRLLWRNWRHSKKMGGPAKNEEHPEKQFLRAHSRAKYMCNVDLQLLDAAWARLLSKRTMAESLPDPNLLGRVNDELEDVGSKRDHLKAVLRELDESLEAYVHACRDAGVPCGYLHSVGIDYRVVI